MSCWTVSFLIIKEVEKDHSFEHLRIVQLLRKLRSSNPAIKSNYEPQSLQQKEQAMAACSALEAEGCQRMDLYRM